MGRPKQALPVGDGTMVGQVATTLLEAGAAGVVVVTRHELLDALRLPSSPRIHTAFNDDARTQMIDSIRIGVEALGEPSDWAVSPAPPDAVMVVPGDMPLISADTIRACLAAYRQGHGGIVVATHAARRGHPIVFPLSMAPVLAALKGGLRTLLGAQGDVREVPVDDPGVLRDVNTPGDYESIRRGAGGVGA